MAREISDEEELNRDTVLKKQRWVGMLDLFISLRGSFGQRVRSSRTSNNDGRR